MALSKWILSSLMFLVLSFQNCANVELMPPQEEFESLSEKPSGILCGPQGKELSKPMKFIFMIDMSMSNVGILQVSSNNNKTTYRIDQTDGPTDLEGKRFDQVEDFIKNCGGPDSEYSIIGFAEHIYFSESNSCFSPFENQTNALKSLKTLKDMQKHDITRGAQSGNNPFYLGGETYYHTALSCLHSKINADLTLGTATDIAAYGAYFLTDGGTTDSPDQRNYSQVMNQIKEIVSASAASFDFQAVFYTRPGAKNQGEEQTSAMSMLNQIGSYIAPSHQTLLLQDILSASTALCEKLNDKIQVNYKLHSSFVVNTNLIPHQSTLLVDSDGDGVPDQLEITRGWDPTNPRSTGMLDVLCEKLGGNLQSCQDYVQSLSCESSPAPIGLTDCDLQVAKTIYGSTLSGSDTDGDGVPDYIEIIRGLNPTRKDTLDNPSGDGISNLTKIGLGLDIKSSVKQFPVHPSQHMDVRVSTSAFSCDHSTQEAHHFSLEQTPLLTTLPLPSLSDTDQGNNTLYVVNYWSPQGHQKIPFQVFIQPIKLKSDGSAINYGDNIYLGEF